MSRGDIEAGRARDWGTTEPPEHDAFPIRRPDRCHAAPALGMPRLRRSTSGWQNRDWSGSGACRGLVERDFTAARDRERPGAFEDFSRHPTECGHFGDLSPADVVDPGPIRGELGAGLGTRARGETYRFTACNLFQPDVQLAVAVAVLRVC